jgi:hypothetical protein
MSADDLVKVKAHNGRLIHLKRRVQGWSLCGRDPSGGRSGWWRVDESAAVTCEKCARQAKNLAALNEIGRADRG